MKFLHVTNVFAIISFSLEMPEFSFSDYLYMLYRRSAVSYDLHHYRIADNTRCVPSKLHSGWMYKGTMKIILICYCHYLMPMSTVYPVIVPGETFKHLIFKVSADGCRCVLKRVPHWSRRPLNILSVIVGWFQANMDPIKPAKEIYSTSYFTTTSLTTLKILRKRF